MPPSRVSVHVAHADEELMIARLVCRVLRFGAHGLTFPPEDKHAEQSQDAERLQAKEP